MNKGKLFGVGVGPGDKELITIKALRVIKEADIIAVPLMKNGEHTAFDIVKEYAESKPVIECVMPMTRIFDELEKNYKKISEELAKILDEGKNIAFITLGDPTVYSSYMRINSIIIKKGYETEIIPAVTSFCAAAAKLNMSLCERNEPLIILPMSYNKMKDYLEIKGTKVLMKANKSIFDICDVLQKKKLADKSVLIECCGMQNERVYKDINKINEKTSYFSIVIVKE